MSSYLNMPTCLKKAIENLECDPECRMAPGDGHVARDYLIRRTGLHRMRDQMHFRVRVEVRCSRCRQEAYLELSDSVPDGCVIAMEERGELSATPEIDPKDLSQRRLELVGAHYTWRPLSWIYEPRGKAPGKPPKRG